MSAIFNHHDEIFQSDGSRSIFVIQWTCQNSRLHFRLYLSWRFPFFHRYFYSLIGLLIFLLNYLGTFWYWWTKYSLSEFDEIVADFAIGRISCSVINQFSDYKVKVVVRTIVENNWNEEPSFWPLKIAVRMCCFNAIIFFF